MRQAQHRSDTPPFQTLQPMSKVIVAPSPLHRLPKDSPRQRSVLAAFGSSTNTPAAPCWVGCKVLLELNFTELSVVETAKFVSQTPQSPDKTELRPNDVNQVTEPGPSRQTRDHSRLDVAPQPADHPPPEGSCSGCQSCTPRRLDRRLWSPFRTPAESAHDKPGCASSM